MPKVDVEAKTMSATPPKTSRFRRGLRISLLVILTHALAWAIGRGQGYFATRAVEEESERASTALRHSRDVVLRFEAERAIELAEAALDARNFGIAEAQVARATRLLGASHPPAELANLVDALSKYQPVVTENPSEQHQQLATWRAQMDTALPQQDAEAPATSR